MPETREQRRARDQRRRQRLRDEQEARAVAGSLPEDDVPSMVLTVPDPDEEEPMAIQTEQPLWWCRFTVPGLGFFTYHGVNYDRGQLLPMLGGPRDEQLQRMGYVQPAPKEEAHLRAQCGVCGADFLTEQFRDHHGRARHSDRFAPAELDIGGGMAGPDGGTALRDITGDADERRMQQQYPLYMEKTRATLESGA